MGARLLYLHGLGPRVQHCSLVVFMLNVLNYCCKILFSAPVRLYYIFSLRGLVDFVSTLPIILYWRSVSIVLSTPPKLDSCTWFSVHIESDRIICAPSSSFDCQIILNGQISEHWKHTNFLKCFGNEHISQQCLRGSGVHCCWWPFSHRINLSWPWFLMQSLDGNLLFWVQSVIDNIVLHATTKIIILVGVHSPGKNNGAAILLFLRVLR